MNKKNALRTIHYAKRVFIQIVLAVILKTKALRNNTKNGSVPDSAR